MKSHVRAVAAVVWAFVLTGGIALTAASPASAAATPPPWQPEVNTFANGTLSFYDSTGQLITGGSTTDSPFVAYAQGSVAGRTGDKVASIYFYTPTSSLPPGAWTGALIGSTTYPNPAAPSALASSPLPLESGAAGDEDLADYISSTPNTDSTAGYVGVYEIRLRTTAPGVAGTSLWQVADILVNGNTWTQVYPAAQTPTTTALKAAPNPATVGQKVTLTATVTPTGTAGSVQFKDGATNIGTPVAVNGTGVAKTSTTTLNQATHALSAVFTPTSTSFAGSTGTFSEVVAVTGVGSLPGTLSGKITFAPALKNTPSAGTVRYTFTAILGSVTGSTTQGSASITGATIKATVTLPAGTTCNSYTSGGFVRGANAVTYTTTGGPVAKTTLTFGSSLSSVAIPYTVSLASPTVTGSFATPSGSASHGTLVFDQTKAAATTSCGGTGLAALAFTGKKGTSSLTIG